MTTFKQKAIEALKQMKLKKDVYGLFFTFADQHNQTVRDCISRIEAIEDIEEDENIESLLYSMKENDEITFTRMGDDNFWAFDKTKRLGRSGHGKTPTEAMKVLSSRIYKK